MLIKQAAHKYGIPVILTPMHIVEHIELILKHVLKLFKSLRIML